MAEMSEDVVFHILCWLPVVSLLRFKSVCKAWRSLIGSPHFITQHLKFGKEGNGNIVLDPGTIIEPPCFALLSGHNLQRSTRLHLPQRLHKLGVPRIIASCNGIICMHHKSRTVVSLWNPATKRYRFVPKCPLPLPKELRMRVHYGFGSVTNTNDYKVVRISFEDYRYAAEDYHNSNIKSAVMVYSLNANSWTPIQTLLPLDYIFTSFQATFRDGVCCWYGRHHYSENELATHHSFILSFDLTTHIFGTIPLPNVYSHNSDARLMFSLLCDKLACIEWQLEFSEKGDWHCKIWVLNDSGVKESWTHLYTICLVQKNETWAFPIAFSMDGGLIWKKKGNLHQEHNLCLCDPVTQDSRVIPFERFITHNLQAPIYKESLVSLETADAASHRASDMVSAGSEILGEIWTYLLGV